MGNYWNSYNTKDLRSKYLYRFVPMKHLIGFLKIKGIWFARADQFMDKMECVPVHELLKEKPNYQRIVERKQRNIICCMHAADNESLALWDSYVDDKSDRKIAAIRFVRKELVNLVHDSVLGNDWRLESTPTYTHGAIKYRNLTTMNGIDPDDLLIKYSAFRKESAFKFENEYRFVISFREQFKTDGYLYRLFSPLAIPFEILVNPLLNADEYKSIREVVIEKGYSENLKESVLNRWLHPEEW